MSDKLNVSWVTPAALADVPSPALILGLEPIERNMRAMLDIAGGPERLRPHVKTHKLDWIVKRQLAMGVKKFKCATIAEAEMCAQQGAPDVLLAYQMVGPNVQRFLALQKKYPQTKFSTVADDLHALRALGGAAKATGSRIELLLDLNVGQNRTGISPGVSARSAYEEIARNPNLIPGGLHAYDGHMQIANLTERTAACDAAIAPVLALREQLQGAGLPVPRIVAGGSPTFPLHAKRPDFELSPGTAIFWDGCYANILSEMPFEIAAVLLTRVVSKPADDRVCLDLGHKSVASEMPQPRVAFPALPDAEGVTHSEEHLVIKTSVAKKLAVGDMLLGVPWHICPSVAVHAQAVLVEGGKVKDTSPITARVRKLTI